MLESDFLNQIKKYLAVQEEYVYICFMLHELVYVYLRLMSYSNWSVE